MTVLDEAFVEITPRFDTFEGRLEAGITGALRNVERAVTAATGRIEQSFQSVATSASQALNSVDANFSDATSDANAAGDRIENSFTTAATESSQALSNVDGNFTDAVSEADQAGNRIDDAFADAATEASRELNDVDPNFSQAVSEADRAGTQIDQAFTESAEDADRALADIGDNAFNDVSNQANRAAESIEDEFQDGSRGAGEQIRRFSRRAQDDLDDVGDEAQDISEGMRRTFTRLGGVIATVFAVDRIAEFFSESVSQAADLGESINAVSVVLGEGADSFLDFGRDSANALGLTQSALNEAIVPMGALLQNAGSGGEVLSDQLQQLAQRATDVGSVFNRDVNEVLEAFGAALRGETEPIRAFGVQLDAASVAAKAVELGLAASTNEVSNAARTQAAFAVIMEQTNVAAGDFANTADSLPNLMRRFNATLDETQISLGEGIIPGLQALGTTALESLEDLDGPFRELGDATGDALTQLEPLVEVLAQRLAQAISVIAPVLPDVAEAFAAIFTATSPLVPVLAELASSIAPLVAGLATTISTILGPALELVADIVSALPSDVQALGAAFFLLSRRVQFSGRALGTVGLALGALGTVLSIFNDDAETAATTFEEIGLSAQRLRRGQIDDVTQQIIDLHGEFEDIESRGFIERFTDRLFSLDTIFHPLRSSSDETRESFEKFTEALQPLDQEFANLVSGGDIESTEEALSTLADGLGLTDDEMQQLVRDAMPALNAALESQKLAAEEAAEEVEQLGAATEGVGAALDRFDTEQTALEFVNLATAISESEAQSEDMEAVADSLGISLGSLEAIVPGVTEQFNTFVGAIQSTMPGVGDVIEGAFTRAQEAGRELTFADVRASIDETLATAEQFATDLQTLLDAGLVNLFNLAVQGGPEVGRVLAQGVGDAAIPGMEENLGRLNEIMQQQTLQLAADAAVVSFFVGEALKNGTLDGIEALPEDIRNVIQNAVGDVIAETDHTEASGAVGAADREAFMTAFNRIVPRVTDVVNRFLPQSIQLGTGPNTQAATGLSERIRDTVQRVTSQLPPFFQRMFNVTIPDNISSGRQRAANAGTGVGRSAASGTSTGANTVRGTLQRLFGISIPNDILGGRQRATNAARGVGSSAGSGVATGISSRRQNARNAASGIISSAISAARGAIGGTFSIGSAITGGIASGIGSSSAIGRIIAAARAAISAALAAARRFAGIFSPSRVFAREIGSPITEGIAQGITSAESQVLDATRQIIDNAARLTTTIPVTPIRSITAPISQQALDQADLTGVDATISGRGLTRPSQRDLIRQVQWDIRSDGTQLGDALVAVLQKTVISRGGNVQDVLGSPRGARR